MAVIDLYPNYSIFITLTIDGKEYGSKPDANDNTITSLKVSKYGGSVADNGIFIRADLSISYRHAPSMYEEILQSITRYPDGRPPITLQWGYVNGPVSPLFSMELAKCEPTNTWDNLSLVLIQLEVSKKYTEWNSATKDLLASKEWYNVSDVVSAIAEGQGWNVGNITSTKAQVPNADGTQDPILIRSYTSTPLNSISEIVGRYSAVSTTNENGYVSTMKFTTDYPDGLYYFMPTLNLTHGYGIKDHTYEYVINGMSHGTVIDFTPKFYGNIYTDYFNSGNDEPTVVSRLRSTSPQLSFFAQDTSELINLSPTATSRSVPDNDNIADPVSFASYIQLSENNPTIAKNFTDISEFSTNITRDGIKKYMNVISLRTTADMTIVGDPDLNPFDYINVLVMYPADWNMPVKLHPSSGVYQIIKITDQIEQGTWKTQLTLLAVDENDFDASIGQPISDQPVPKDFSPIQVGDIVYFMGGPHYHTSYGDPRGGIRTAGPAIVTHLNWEAPYPIHVIGGEYNKQAGGTSNVYGWVDQSQVTKKGDVVVD